MSPTAEEYDAGADPARNARFTGGAFAGIDLFPYSSVEWSLLGVSPPIAALAEALLGTAAVRSYEAHNWAKYAGATDYDQQLHRDYGNHTPVVPSDDPSFAEVEMFIYIHHVPEELGPPPRCAPNGNSDEVSGQCQANWDGCDRAGRGASRSSSTAR
jgi:hypothetical protein